MELWKQIPLFENYSVCTNGEIRNNTTGKFLSFSENQYGVIVVGLVREGKQCHRSVPLIVANAFIPKKYEAFDTPINRDGDRRNNDVENLVWRPRWFAVQYNRQFRIPYEFPVFQEVQDVDSGRVWKTSFECARDNGLLERDVVLSIANRTVAWPTHQRFRIVD